MDRTGLLLGLGCYLSWGAFPLFFRALEAADATEIVAHRAAWSLLVCVLLLLATGGLGAVVRVLRDRRAVVTLGIASVFIAGNWLIYVYGVNTGRTVDAALGYFINPLVTILLAVFVLKERLRPAQWASCAIGAAAVLVIGVGYGQVPWISLGLAFSFGMYGLVKNRAGRTVGALPGLAVETAVLSPLAVTYLLWLGWTGQGTFTPGDPGGVGHMVLLASAGAVTAAPLLLFAGAARRLPLSVVGMLQYLTPALQLITGVVVFGEEMPAERWAGFVLVWVAIAVLTVDGVRHNRQRRGGTPRVAV
ncbi:EamA family transporter RarD [Georgenia sp. 10Sc9-8]|uniref:EamA family transporter RarD n=1 Tax=Georgenia halotolerans TaxID=3028317 RepID=A0ABT5TV78_9MICO|nr:EamA family transporter RarD [Georgenia halotolerans]